ncbi:MAG: DUF6089 family protein [Bacteroidota bacterium]
MKFTPAAILLCFFTFLSYQSLAQRTHALSIGVGTLYYYGDLTDRFNNSLVRPAGSISYSKYLTRMFSFRVGVSYGEIGAQDLTANDTGRRLRNLHFKSNILEFSGVLVYEFIPDRNFGNEWVGKPHFSPFVFGGISMFHFNPKARYNNVWYALQPLGTEGQHIPGNPIGPYSLIQASVPFGAGVNLRLSEFAGVNFEIGYRITMTDYLDDVSTVYPDFGALTESSGTLAVELSERSDGNVFLAGEQRGFSGANDGYFFTMVSLVYYLNRFASRD